MCIKEATCLQVYGRAISESKITNYGDGDDDDDDDTYGSLTLIQFLCQVFICIIHLIFTETL